MAVIGLCGRRGAGKDTFASMLSKAVPSFTRLSFAARLKEVCVRVFGLNEAQVNDPIGKETLLPQPVDIDSKIDELRRETGLFEIQRHGLVAATPRRLLQYVGTDYVRTADEGYWVRAVEDRVSACRGLDTNFVATDVRFPNEAFALRRYGGLIVRILRVADEIRMVGQGAEHESERIAFAPDFTLAVMEGDMLVPEVVCHFASKGMLREGLEAFNWDLLSFSAPICERYYGPIWKTMRGLADASAAEAMAGSAK